jgi:hypothetical protein
VSLLASLFSHCLLFHLSIIPVTRSDGIKGKNVMQEDVANIADSKRKAYQQGSDFDDLKIL